MTDNNPMSHALKLAEALENLVRNKDAFDASDSRNQADAYYCLVKGRDADWKAAREALTAYRASEIKDSELAPGEDARPHFAGVGVAATRVGSNEWWIGRRVANGDATRPWYELTDEDRAALGIALRALQEALACLWIPTAEQIDPASYARIAAARKMLSEALGQAPRPPRS